MATYATVDDLRAFAPELAERGDPELERALGEAEKDVDSYAGFYTIDATSGRKFVLADQDALDSAAITRATCAQARYRIYMGPVFFIEQRQYDDVSGDISNTKASRYGPEMIQEFPGHLRRRTGRMRTSAT